MDTTATHRRARRLGGWTIGVLCLGLGLTGCAGMRSDAGADKASTTSSAAPATAGTAEVTVASDPTDTGGTPPNTRPGNGATTTHRAGTDSAATPKVESLTVVTKPSCPVIGSPDAPYATRGHDIVIRWKVSGAKGSAIAVDNPGLYGAYSSDYPATGQLTLPFPCSGSTGNTTHTYTVWPAGAKGVSKTLTVSAQNNP